MSERHYKKVINRHQSSLFPPSMEDYITRDNPVRAIDAYVESLDMSSFKFHNAGIQYTAGQPAYPPQGLLKLYLYGYLNRVRSSRRLEKEVHRNVEAIWLMEGLKPSYKTIANFRNDVKQLLPMAQRSQEVMEREKLTVVADAGYYNPEQIKACQEAGITPYVSIPNKSNAIKAQGRFTREQFQFDVEQNHYRCPAGQLLKQVGKPYKKRGRMMLRYKPKARDCCQCGKREQCLTKKAKIRQINRWEHESVIDAHRARMKAKGPEMMRRRSGLAEHPFGTLKRWFGWNHFLVRGFGKVRGEMSLMVLGYNLTRVIHTIGVEAFRDYCASKKRMAEVCVESAVMA